MAVRLFQVVAPNTGYAFELFKFERLRISGNTIVDLVVFNLENTKEKFDQARTKANQGKIFISTEDQLISKFNNTMMTILEDTSTEGHHDLQEGMCSRRRYELVAMRGDLSETYGRPLTPEDIPDHGCWENLSTTLKSWNILPEDIPSPLNLFQNMSIDPVTGKMKHTNIRPKLEAYVLFRAEMDLLVALSACPDLVVGGKQVVVSVET